MKIGIIGLGLIGGSMAKALKEYTEHEVYGLDAQPQVIRKAKLLSAIDGELTEDNLGEMDFLMVCLYPRASVDFVKKHAKKIKKGATVMDCCGVKRIVCEALEPVAKKNGFFFIGAHPMAGMEHSGFSYSKKTLFNGASMVLTPAKGTKIEDLQRIKLFCVQIGFSNIEISTPEEHDRMIAFTSDLAHVVSNAYIKSPMALEHKGFSAGSYRDMTRVAKLNESMWAELFLENKDFLTEELEGLIERLRDYLDAMEEDDEEALKTLLREGREAKMLIDGEKF